MNSIINKKKPEKEESVFKPYRKIGSFESGIHRSLKCVAHSRTSYLVRPYSI